MAITCQVCGTVNPDGTQYCEGCGVELTPTQTNAQPDAASQPSPVPNQAPEQAPTSGPASEPAPEATSPNDGERADHSPEPLGQDASASGEVGAESAEGASPVPGTAPPATLLIKRYGAVTSEAIPLQGERMVVGRFDPSTGPVDIDVTNLPGAEHISRHHGELYTEGGVWRVRDLGSTNGVFIKRAGESSYGPRLQEPSDIGDGDEIAFGNVVFVFRHSQS